MQPSGKSWHSTISAVSSSIEQLSSLSSGLDIAKRISTALRSLVLFFLRTSPNSRLKHSLPKTYNALIEFCLILNFQIVHSNWSKNSTNSDVHDKIKILLVNNRVGSENICFTHTYFQLKSWVSLCVFVHMISFDFLSLNRKYSFQKSKPLMCIVQA